MQDYVGYRTRKRQEKRKKWRVLWRVVIVIVALFVIFVILGAAFNVPPFDKAWDKTVDGFVWVGRKIKGIFPSSDKVEPAEFLEEGKKTANYLIAVTKDADGEKRLSSLILASYDSRDETGSLIYFPADLRVEIPGAGDDLLSNLIELDDGNIGMTLVAVTNMLGVEIDRYILGSDRDVRLILNKLGKEFPVNVPENVSFEDKSLDTSVELSPGEQTLSGSELASYLTYTASGKEMDLIERQQEFAPVLLEKSSETGVFNDIPQFVKENANLFDTSASNDQLTGFWQAFADLGGDDLSQGTIPVEEVKIENTVVHILDRDKLDDFKEEYIKSESEMTSRVRVEILNGCGVPGIGEEVASELDPVEFQVINNANADSFEHEQTVILLYSEDKDMISAAERALNALEVGRIEFRVPTQSLIDFTIVVGRDYANK